MSLADQFAPQHDADIRLAILKLLEGQSDGSASDAVLAEAVNALRLVCSRDKLREHLFWLANQGVVHTLDMRAKSGLVIATLTEKGYDIALGRATMAGVARIRDQEA